jgi:adenine-specific DNA-methyltransferase
MVKRNHHIIVGDAPGVDTAFQRRLHERTYDNVTVFHSGRILRNNLGGWRTETIQAAPGVRGFDLHAAKDRAMAEKANAGLMLWNGESPVTLLNILRMVHQRHPVVLMHSTGDEIMTLRSSADWALLCLDRAGCGMALHAAALSSRSWKRRWSPNANARRAAGQRAGRISRIGLPGTAQPGTASSRKRCESSATTCRR